MASMRRRIEERDSMLKLVATLACLCIPCTGPSQRLSGQGKKDLGKDCGGDGRRRLEIAAGFPEGGGLGCCKGHQIFKGEAAHRGISESAGLGGAEEARSQRHRPRASLVALQMRILTIS
jgi:hypothetical protein